MKNQRVKILIVLGVFFTLSGIMSNNNSNGGSLVIDEDDTGDNINLPQSSYYNNSENPIFINGSATGVEAHNWTWAASQPWCKGSGTENNPYVIENITIDCGGVGSAISIVESNAPFRIQNCTLTNSENLGRNAGVYLDMTHNGTIFDNNCSKNYYGISLQESTYINITGNTLNNNSIHGITGLYGLNYSTIADNNILFNDYFGIYIGDEYNSQEYCNITSNNISYNNMHGLRLETCHYFEVRDNNITHNSKDAGTNAGILLQNVFNISIENNNCSYNEDKGIYFMEYDGNNVTIRGNDISFNKMEGIEIGVSAVCDNITIEENSISNNTNTGILISASLNNSVIANNNITLNQYNGIHFQEDVEHHNWVVIGNNVSYNNFHGMRLEWLYNSKISDNNVSYNTMNGIFLNNDCDGNNFTSNTLTNNSVGLQIDTGSTLNYLYNNTFKNNMLHALDNGANNNWNNTDIGNYWDNYTGNDDDDDGRGDTPHDFGTGIDYLPIWEDGGLKISIDATATGVGAHNWTWAASQPWCSGSGTWADPYVIEGLIIDAEGSGSGIFINNSKNVYFIIRNCNVSNSGSGTTEGGISLENTCNGTVEDNICLDNGYNGIFLTANSCNNTIQNNYVNNSGNAGIYIFSNCIENLISGNNLTYNINDGIYIFNSDDNSIFNNSARFNENTGIYLSTGSKNNTVFGNTVSDNEDDGIFIFSSSTNNTIYNNTVSNNLGYGIRLLNNADDNIIRTNTITGNSNNDIEIVVGCDYTILIGNIITGLGLNDGGSNNIDAMNKVNGICSSLSIDAYGGVWGTFTWEEVESYVPWIGSDGSWGEPYVIGNK